MLFHFYDDAVEIEAVQNFVCHERAFNDLSDDVVHLIYMCAFMLQVGESVGSASLPRSHPDSVRFDEATGTCSVCEPPVQLFYADVPSGQAKRMENLVTSQSAKAQMDVIMYPAWKFNPTTYLKTTADRVLFPEWQQRQIDAVKRADVRLQVETFDASHSPFLSLPEEMLAVIERIVR